MASLKDLAEGKPLRIPLHPALVHLPIALFPVSVVLDIASWFFRGAESGLGRAAFICLIAGVATGLFAAFFGLVDFSDIRDDHPAKKTATRHMVVNVIAIGLFWVSALIRSRLFNGEHTAVLPLVLSLAGLAMLGYGGYLGGELVYNDGIGVGRHRRRTETPGTTIIRRLGRRPNPEGGFVSVADTTAVGEGETLRVSVDGTVMTIARVDGVFYAFQEFCTHRYGPLSEGALHGCEVVCPWHNSRFDLRTGKVTAGPAKVDLKTYKIESRDGQIWIETPPKPGELGVGLSAKTRSR